MIAATELIYARRFREAFENIEKDLGESIYAANVLGQSSQGSAQSGQESQSEPSGTLQKTSDSSSINCNLHDTHPSQTRTFCKSQGFHKHWPFASLLKMFGLGSPSMSRGGRFIKSKNKSSVPVELIIDTSALTGGNHL